MADEGSDANYDAAYADTGQPQKFLSIEDTAALRRWREALILQSPYGEHKSILKLVAAAMTDEAFRTRLLTDTDAVITEFKRMGWTYPDDITIKFYDNTRDVLNIVLPPRAGAMKSRPPALREVLRSGSATFSTFDDFDHGNASFDNDHGDHTANDGGHHY
jgi:hypothetical protein